MSTDLDLSPAAILARAADVIDRNGFAQDSFWLADGSKDPRDCKVCMLGAIAVAAGLSPGQWDDVDADPAKAAAAEAAAALLAERLDGDESASVVEVVGNWNDDAEDAYEATAELRAAADKAREPAPLLVRCTCSEFAQCPAHGGVTGDMRLVDGPNGAA